MALGNNLFSSGLLQDLRNDQYMDEKLAYQRRTEAELWAMQNRAMGIGNQAQRPVQPPKQVTQEPDTTLLLLTGDDE
jgi:hypothetical protein